MAEGVAGEGVAELGHCAEVAGVQLGDFDGFAALHDGEVGEALLAAAGVVFDGGVVFDDAADDLEEADAAGEGVGHGLEDHQGKRLAVGDLAGGMAASGSSVLAAASMVGVRTAMGPRSTGEGHVDLDEVEQVVEGHVGEAAGEEHGEDAVFADGFVERGDEVLFGERAGLEVLLHQLVLAFGDQLDESLVAGLGVGGQVGGDFGGDLAAAIAAGGVIVGLHGDQIDDAVEAFRAGDGQLDGNTVAAPAVDQVVDEGAQSAAAAGLGVVHLIDDDDAGNAGLVGIAPDALGDRLRCRSGR